MNAATTLYWQIPFTTYDPDQFFALGLDGFSPLGWRLFDFKHSKQTTKPMLVKNIFYNSGRKLQTNSLLSYNLQLEILNHSLGNKSNQWKKSFENETKQNSKNRARKIQKRQKRVKKHPTTASLVSFGTINKSSLTRSLYLCFLINALVYHETVISVERFASFRRY